MTDAQVLEAILRLVDHPKREEGLDLLDAILDFLNDERPRCEGCGERMRPGEARYEVNQPGEPAYVERGCARCLPTGKVPSEWARERGDDDGVEYGHPDEKLGDWWL